MKGTSKTSNLGWLIAAALAGSMVGSGFQGPTEKTGVVDLAKMVESSDFGKLNQASFNQMKQAREGVLEFMTQYPVFTQEQAIRFRDLSIKETAVKPEEKAELDRIKADVIAADKKSKELSIKTNLTPEERTLITEYSNRAQAVAQTQDRWYREFTTDLQNWTDKQKVASIEKARAALTEVAKTQAFTTVFEVGVAPYGANDLTDAALKAMNAKK